MSNQAMTVTDHIKWVGVRAADIERQYLCAKKLSASCNIHEVLKDELKETYHAMAMMFCVLTDWDAEIFRNLSDFTISALCDLEEEEYIWVTLKRTSCDASSQFDSHELHTRRMLKSLRAELARRCNASSSGKSKFKIPGDVN